MGIRGPRGNTLIAVQPLCLFRVVGFLGFTGKSIALGLRRGIVIGLDFLFYNSKGKVTHTIERMEREEREKPKREEGVPQL